jgi:hypothetical protein
MEHRLSTDLHDEYCCQIILFLNLLLSCLSRSQVLNKITNAYNVIRSHHHKDSPTFSAI